MQQIWITTLEVYGKKFTYKSKYGGITKGIIARIFFLIDSEGKLKIHKIASTNNVNYSAEEIQVEN